jgi:hypothetical protein
MQNIHIGSANSPHLSYERRMHCGPNNIFFKIYYASSIIAALIITLKGTVSRDNPYSNFFIDHILLVLLEVLYGDF